MAVVVAVLVATNLVAHFTTTWASIAAVPIAALVLLGLMRRRGLGWADLGLCRSQLRRGALYALGAVGLVVAVVAIGAALPWTRPMFMADRYATISGALIASMVVIPLQTAIPEELAFRGVLHGTLSRVTGFRGVALAGSMLFGLWHIASSLGLTASNRGLSAVLGGGATGQILGIALRRRRDGGGRFRIHLAASTQRQPARAHRAALVGERRGRTGRRGGLARDHVRSWRGPGTARAHLCGVARPPRVGEARGTPDPLGRLRQRADQRPDVDPRTGEERDLRAHVPTGLGGA